MHDLWFAGKIILLLKEKIGKGKQPARIVVNVAVSPLCHVTAESLEGAFNILSEKEGFKNVVLNVKKGEIEIGCKKCGKNIKVEHPIVSCPLCGASDFNIPNMEEFVIQSLEIAE